MCIVQYLNNRLEVVEKEADIEKNRLKKISEQLMSNMDKDYSIEELELMIK